MTTMIVAMMIQMIMIITRRPAAEPTTSPMWESGAESHGRRSLAHYSVRAHSSRIGEDAQR